MWQVTTAVHGRYRIKSKMKKEKRKKKHTQKNKPINHLKYTHTLAVCPYLIYCNERKLKSARIKTISMALIYICLSCLHTFLNVLMIDNSRMSWTNTRTAHWSVNSDKIPVIEKRKQEKKKISEENEIVSSVSLCNKYTRYKPPSCTLHCFLLFQRWSFLLTLYSLTFFISCFNSATLIFFLFFSQCFHFYFYFCYWY